MDENPAEKAALKPLYVLTVNLATGNVVKTPVAAMRDAIAAYKAVLAQARAQRAFVQFDQFNWLATIKLRDGFINVVTINNGEKVLGRAAGAQIAARRAETQAATPLATLA